MFQNNGKTMNKNENSDDYKLYVPSHMNIVNIRNMKGFIRLLDRLPEQFEYQDISNMKEYSVKNLTAISRIVKYLRYMDILEPVKTNGKRLFRLTEKGGELRRIVITKPEKFNEGWSEILRISDLYKSIVNTKEFKEFKYVSSSSLKKLIINSFTKKVKNQDERADKAERFLIQLLEDAKLFYYDNNNLRPIDKISKVESIEDFYHVKTDDYELKVRYDKLAFEMLQMQIDIAKKKFESIQKSKNNKQKI